WKDSGVRPLRGADFRTGGEALMFDRRLGVAATLALFAAMALVAAPRHPAAAAKRAGPARKLYVDNTSGDTVSVIDLDARKVIREIRVGLHPHGLGALPDQSRVFLSVESDHTIKVIDPRTDEILSSIRLSGVPNELAV